MKTKRLIFIIISVFILFGFVAIFSARAVYDNGEGSVIGIRVDVSKDGGNTWYNYTADENPGNQILTVSPGDTLIFRGTVWNEGDYDQGALLGLEGIVTKIEYFDSFDAFENGNDDIDGSGTFYVMNDSNIVNSSLIMDIGLGTAISIDKDVDNPEIGQIEATLKDDIPDQTIIEGTFSLENVVNNVVFNPFRVAHAQGALAQSTVRILVENPEGDEPADEPGDDDAEEENLTALPQTGTDNPYTNILAISATFFVIAFTSWIILKCIKKKEQKI